MPDKSLKDVKQLWFEIQERTEKEEFESEFSAEPLKVIRDVINLFI